MGLRRNRPTGFAARELATWAREIRWPNWPMLGVVAVGIALSAAGAFVVAHYWEDVSARAELEMLGDNRRLLLQHELNNLESTIQAIASHFQASENEVGRSEFARVARQFSDVRHGTIAVDWAPRVRSHERDAHERLAAGQAGLTGYRITAPGDDGAPTTALQREEFFPIYFSTEQAKDPTRMGRDLGSDLFQRGALKRAQLSDALTATPAKPGTAEIFLFAPVYRDDMPRDTVEDNRRYLEGVIRASLSLGPLLDQIFRRVTIPRGLDIYFFREGAGPSDLPFHVRSSLLRSVPASPHPRAHLEAGAHATRGIVFGDQHLTMIVAPIPDASPLVTREHSLMALGVGLLVTLAAALYVELTRRYTERLETITAELRASDAKLTSILATVDNIIWSIDASTYETLYLNPAAERIYGRPASAFYADSRLFMSIVHPEDQQRVGQMLPDLLEHSVMTINYRIVRPGGEIRWLEDRTAVVRDTAGRAVRFNGVASDITERMQLTAASEYRSELLHLASTAAEELLTAASVQDAMAKVLEIMGTIMRVDRVLVLETLHDRSGAPISVSRYAWHAAAAPSIPALEQVPSTLESDAWLTPFRDGKVVTYVPSTMTDGPLKSMFQHFGIMSSLDVPIVIESRYWGRIRFDDCRIEREWTPFEVDTLRTLAEMIGSAIIRERYVQQLKDANTIIERSPIILYRMRGEPSLPLSYISHNITLLGYQPADLIASPELYKSFIHPDDRSRVLESMAGIVQEGGKAGTIEFRLRKSDRSYCWVENRFLPIRDAGGRLVEVEGILTDITERKKAAEKIAYLARTDPLTGLANRATFIDRLRQAFASARRGAPPFAVHYLDLDRFKDINDTLGHAAGDDLLKGVAQRLAAATRQSDLVARFGGDEFAILQTDLADLASAGTLAATIHDRLSAPYPLGQTETHIGASIGIAPFTFETESPDDMLAQADLALYRAKEEGRDQYCFHSADLDHEVRERVALTDDLKLALQRDELELSYQPQVELSTGRIVGMEALIRWHHPQRGLLTPGAFLPGIEKSNVMTSLGQWVLDHACEQMSIWRRSGIAPPILAINLSLVQLRRGDEFVTAVLQTLARWGLSPADLELDVTESMLAHVTLHRNSVLDRLQQLGVKIAIDDFGTQYSSLDYLKTYRVSMLKIPRSMIETATKDPQDLAMVRAIIGVARELEIEVVAQGIETEEERALLAAAPSTTKVQGYYYSAPVHVADATDLLRQRLIEPGFPPARGQAEACAPVAPNPELRRAQS